MKKGIRQRLQRSKMQTKANVITYHPLMTLVDKRLEEVAGYLQRAMSASFNVDTLTNENRCIVYVHFLLFLLSLQSISHNDAL